MKNLGNQDQSTLEHKILAEVKQKILFYFHNAPRPPLENDFAPDIDELADLVSDEMIRRNKYIKKLGVENKDNQKVISYLYDVHSRVFRDTVNYYLYLRPDGKLSFWMSMLAQHWAKKRHQEKRNNSKELPLNF